MPISYETKIDRQGILTRFERFKEGLRTFKKTRVVYESDQRKLEKAYNELTYQIHTYLIDAFDSPSVADLIKPYQRSDFHIDFEDDHDDLCKDASDALASLEQIRNGMNPVVIPPREESPFSVRQILAALSQFQECVRYLKNRRAKPLFEIRNEDDVQDLIYFMLRPWIIDLTNEAPADKTANQFSIMDFNSKVVRTVVEAKYIRNKDHGKKIVKELNDDIAQYHSTLFDSIIFFVYDPNDNIPDMGKVRSAVEVDRTVDGRKLTCYYVSSPI